MKLVFPQLAIVRSTIFELLQVNMFVFGIIQSSNSK